MSSDPNELPQAPTREAVCQQAGDLFAIAFTMARDVKTFDLDKQMDLALSACAILTGYECGILRQQMQREIDCRQEEILRLQKLTRVKPGELF